MLSIRFWSVPTSGFFASLKRKTLSAIWLRTSCVFAPEALSTGTSTPTSSTVIAIVTIAAIDGAALRRSAR